MVELAPRPPGIPPHHSAHRSGRSDRQDPVRSDEELQLPIVPARPVHPHICEDGGGGGQVQVQRHPAAVRLHQEEDEEHHPQTVRASQLPQTKAYLAPPLVAAGGRDAVHFLYCGTHAPPHQHYC